MSFKHLIPLLVALLFLLFVNLSHSKTPPELCHPHDKNVLLRIKNHLGNPSSLWTWNPNTDCNDWGGVQLNEQGRVATLQIEEDEDIHGPIPPFLDELPFLFDLVFYNVPNLSGPIPPYIGKLTNLTRIFLYKTNVGGPIPSFLGQLINLSTLNLYNNKFTGPIPNSLGRLKKLDSLDLSSNSLTGQIPQALAELTNLRFLDLKSNQLSGRIPKFLGQKLKNLITLNLDFNLLSGTIPENLGFLPVLQSLSLTGNKLSGSVPRSLGRGNLLGIYLNQNKLTGDASFLFEKPNTKFSFLEVADNLLKFDFTNVDLVPNLSTLNISHNLIYGSLPKRFGLLRPDSVDVSYNQLCGPIPNGRRFKGVDPAKFSHNNCLCGGPFPGCK